MQTFELKQNAKLPNDMFQVLYRLPSTGTVPESVIVDVKTMRLLEIAKEAGRQEAQAEFRKAIGL